MGKNSDKMHLEVYAYKADEIMDKMSEIGM